MVYFIAALGFFVFPAILYYCEHQNWPVRSLIAKAVASSAFVVLGFYAQHHVGSNIYTKGMLVGLILGAIGDVLINCGPVIHNTLLALISGGAFFFAGHFFYTIHVAKQFLTLSLLEWALGVLFVVLVLLLLTFLCKTDWKLQLVFSIYMAVVSFFTYTTVLSFIQTGTLETGILALGGFVFLLADFDLMLFNMGKKQYAFVRPCLYIYYPAQVLLALSMYFQLS